MRQTFSWALVLVLAGTAGAFSQGVQSPGPDGQVFAHGVASRAGFTLPPPPDVETRLVSDDYSGTQVTDDYRWLEDANSADTKSFIDEQNAYTGRYMEDARIRPQVVDALESLEQVTVWGTPIQRGDDLFFEKRLAGEDQAAIYMRHGWMGPASQSKDKRLVDPAQFSRDPNTSVDLDDVSRDGSLIAYSVRQGGADETTVQFYNVKSGKTLFDVLPSANHFSVVFTPDGRGVFYTRTDAKGTLVYEHTFGTRTFLDKLLFGNEFRGEELGPADLIDAWVTDDGHYLVVHIDRGVPAKRVDIVYKDLTKPDSYFDVLTWGIESRFSAAYDKGSWYVKTDYKSPNGRILKAYPGIMPEAWDTIVPENQDAIQGFSIVGHKLFVQRLHDVKTETSIYTLEGKPAGSIDYGGIGTASDVSGRTMDRYGFYDFQSFITPPTIYRIDTVTGRARSLRRTRCRSIPASTS